ncbi:uncharacterized protein LOC122061408 [Macadamia integrifolia]|uniref:uncharacterized protein LOC122061408 n=1 Tax=Macadamia integrifolia TaxID=60698 RepID=UPI001C53114A|nr:uncharacterized protein LOC122061408 [Macadamia integrifolia]
MKRKDGEVDVGIQVSRQLIKKMRSKRRKANIYAWHGMSSKIFEDKLLNESAKDKAAVLIDGPSNEQEPMEGDAEVGQSKELLDENKKQSLSVEIKKSPKIYNFDLNELPMNCDE